MAAYGYRYGEIPLPKLPDSDPSFRIEENPEKEHRDMLMGGHRRDVVQVSLGCHFVGAALPHPDPSDPDTLRAGVLKRFVLDPPKAKPGLLEELRAFTKAMCSKHLKPLPPNVDLSVETWLEGCKYPRWRKDDLLRKWDAIGGNLVNKRRFSVCKSFMKDEVYPEYKHARAINSRTDEFKCAVGPLFKLIEQEVFKLPCFVKKIPVRDRPKYLIERLFAPGKHYFPTDYSAFESLFVEQLMDVVEFELYEYMTSELAQNDEFMAHCRKVIGGDNECVFKFFRVWIRAKRMSGEMNTSLGNGFSNWIFTEFVSWKHDAPMSSIHEGDDGLISSDVIFQESWFTDLGLIIKLQRVDSITEASFCGIIFSDHDLVNITNPIEEILSFGWTTHKYHKSSQHKKKMLLRCKGLSLLYQYPGCPVIQNLALYALRVTRSFDVRGFVEKGGHFSMWEREQLLESLKVDPKQYVVPGMHTRFLMERVFGMTVEQQLEVEAYLDSLNDLVPLDKSSVLMHCHRDQIHYWDNYVVPDKYGDFPPMLWSKCDDFAREW